MTADDFLFEQEQMACVLAENYTHLTPKMLLQESVINALRCAIEDGVATLEQVAELIVKK